MKNQKKINGERVLRRNEYKCFDFAVSLKWIRIFLIKCSNKFCLTIIKFLGRRELYEIESLTSNSFNIETAPLFTFLFNHLVAYVHKSN